MSANRKQPLEAAYFAAFTTTRRRSVPARPRTPVSMSLHQRWRERPRRRALRLTPACPDGVVHAIVGLSRVAVCEPSSCRRTRAARAYTAGPGATAEGCRGVPQESVRARAVFSRRTHAGSVARSNGTHHRADDAGAVLGVVNALRFASTRPVAGPAGIDDACARHALAIARWWSPDDGSQRC